MSKTAETKKYEAIEKLEFIAKPSNEFRAQVTILTTEEEELNLIIDLTANWIVGCVRQYGNPASPSLSLMSDVPNDQRPFLHQRWKGLGRALPKHDASKKWYTFTEIMLNLASGSPGAKVLVDTFEVRGDYKSSIEYAESTVKAAWCEAFGIDIPTAEDIKQSELQRKMYLDKYSKIAVQLLRSGEAGIKEFNGQSRYLMDRLNFKKMDLKDQNLKEASFATLVVSRSDFSGSNLTDANFSYAKIDNCNFNNCTILGAKFEEANAKAASFHNTTLQNCVCDSISLKDTKFLDTKFKKCTLRYANLKGADLSKASFEDCYFTDAVFDETTIFPDDFPKNNMDSLAWKGKGLDKRKLKAFQEGQASGQLDFQSFLERLQSNVDQGRYDNALSMLKQDSFKLFSNVDKDSVTGVVLSQTSDSLLYSCRLTSSGQYSCCTQNLRPCGGLRGAVCKHILVLVVGLSHAGELDLNDADTWIRATQMQRPELDKDNATQTFLKYKSVEAGEIDWRPTETTPEDFYAF